MENHEEITRFPSPPFERREDAPFADPQPPKMEIVFVDTGFITTTFDSLDPDKKFAEILHNLVNQIPRCSKIEVLRFNVDCKQNGMQRLAATVAAYK